ncbi:DUF1697 domain-containing protein [Actinocorallia lasiicapitis]
MRYVALLRGINVGGRNKIAMADLRAVLDRIGHTEVKTHLQSGNVVFTAPETPTARLEAELAAAIEGELGATLRIMVRTEAELAEVVAANPFPVGDGSRFLVCFLGAPPEPGLFDDLCDAHPPERLAVVGRELYLDLPDGIRDAKLPVLTERRTHKDQTARNWNTVTKLLELCRLSSG